jgi:hypothetical protein
VDIATASEMWVVLKAQYEGQGQSLKAQYLKEIQQLEYSKFENMTSFIVAFKRLHTSLIGVDIKMPDDFYTLTFIEALNSAYPIWADRWRHTAQDTSKPLTLTMLYNDATDEARDRNPVSKETNVALYANNPEAAVVATVVAIVVVANVEAKPQATQAKRSVAIAQSLAIRRRTVLSSSQPKRRLMMLKGQSVKQTAKLSQQTPRRQPLRLQREH